MVKKCENKTELHLEIFLSNFTAKQFDHEPQLD